ncbi:MAG: hypothetical protein ACYC2H_01445 [Thermoplasmatota archaeon]
MTLDEARAELESIFDADRKCGPPPWLPPPTLAALRVVLDALPTREQAPFNASLLRHQGAMKVFAAMHYDARNRLWTGSDMAFAAADVATPRALGRDTEGAPQG